MSADFKDSRLRCAKAKRVTGDAAAPSARYFACFFEHVGHQGEEHSREITVTRPQSLRSHPDPHKVATG
jgi:hypothetical protein